MSDTPICLASHCCLRPCFCITAPRFVAKNRSLFSVATTIVELYYVLVAFASRINGRHGWLRRPRMAEDKDIATYIRRQLKRRDWRQADLVRQSGIGSGRISEWMSGRGTPSPESCMR